MNFTIDFTPPPLPSNNLSIFSFSFSKSQKQFIWLLPISFKRLKHILTYNTLYATVNSCKKSDFNWQWVVCYCHSQMVASYKSKTRWKMLFKKWKKNNKYHFAGKRIGELRSVRNRLQSAQKQNHRVRFQLRSLFLYLFLCCHWYPFHLFSYI